MLKELEYLKIRKINLFTNLKRQVQELDYKTSQLDNYKI
jgi:hypothetical protein